MDGMGESIPLDPSTSYGPATIKVMAKPESNMLVAVDQLVQWSTENLMVVNTNKTKEMLFGSSAAHIMPCIRLNSESIK
jgi:hypothetical protein